MKKLFMYVAMAAVLTMGSCTSGASVPEGQAKITISLAGAGSATRAVEDPAELVPTGTEVSRLVSGTVYVLDTGGNVVYSEALDLTLLASGAVQEINDGAIYPSDSRVYVLGNIPANVDAATLTNWTAISGAVSEIVYPGSYNTDYTRPAMANDTGMPAILVATGDPNVMLAQINLSPLYARIELAGVEGGTHVKEFSVTGVWLDSYYPSFTLAGAGAGTLHDQGQSTEFSGVRGDVDAGDPPSLWTSSTNDTGVAGTAKITADEGDATKVWAYHIGPGSVARFIARVSTASLYAADDDGSPKTGEPTTDVTDRYITVTGYSGGAFSGVFQRGKIYRVTPIVFNEVGDLTEEPNADGVSLTAQITVHDWEEVVITPGI